MKTEILIICSLYILDKCCKTLCKKLDILCKKLDNDEMPKTLFWMEVKRSYDEHRVDK